MKVIKKFNQFVNESHGTQIRKLLSKESFKYKLDCVLLDEHHCKLDMIVDVKITGVDSSVDDRAYVYLGLVDGSNEDKIKKKIDDKSNLHPMSFDLYIYDDGIIVHNDDEGNNNFATEEDFQKFIDILRKFYLSEDKGSIAHMIGKLNDTDLDTHNIEGGEFFEFVKTNFGDFDKLEGSLKSCNGI